MIELNEKDFILKEEKIKALKSWANPEFLKEQERLGNVIKDPSPEPVLRTCVCNLELEGNSVEISYDPDQIKNNNAFFKDLNSSMDWLQNNFENIFELATVDLIDLKNNYWLNDDEPKYTKELLRSNLGQIKNINFISGNEFSLYIDDNNLFLSHLIEVRIKNKKLSEVTLAG
jgi:hypothetical protein